MEVANNVVTLAKSDTKAAMDSPQCVYQVDDQQTLSMQLFGAAASTMTLNLVRLGDKLGMYKALKELGPCTSMQLAVAMGLKERWCREWLYQQAAARLVCTNDKASLFWLAPSQSDVLVNEHGANASPAFTAGVAQFSLSLVSNPDALCTCFKTGLGQAYDEHGPDCALGACRMLGVWVRHSLRQNLASRPEVAQKLEAGCLVADVGCGAGEAIFQLASAYPKSTFHGYDNSKQALSVARERCAGLKNVTFKDPSKAGEALPAHPTYDLVLVLDALHDMARPDLCLRAIHGAIKPDGQFFIGDIKSVPGGPGPNIAGNPFASLLWGFSVPLCMSSALSTPDGLGLGTLGFDAEVAEKMCKEAGFTQFQQLDWENPITSFYLVSP